MLHVILEALDRGNCFVRIFFADFSKGFDLVDHNALVNELELLNVNNVIVSWLCSFLSNRPQWVKIGNVLSNVVINNVCIPQGTKTAPLLFAILVNRLVSSWPIRLKYIDDTTVFEIIPRCSPSYLQFIVNEIEDFASLRGMRFNPKKCKELQVNFLNYQPAPPQGLVLGSASISQVDSYKLLGVYISSDLSWNIHIDYIVKKVCKRLYALRVLARAGVSQTDLVLIYCSLILSVLEYAAPVWACLPEYLNELIESVQRRALKIIFPHSTMDLALGRLGCSPSWFVELNCVPGSCLGRGGLNL